jgi:Ser/Thr protein kinase RdoA (MazF antagonist)
MTDAPISQARWLAIAKHILARYAMPNATVAWLAYTHNPVFDVRRDNARYVLRLRAYDTQHEQWMRSEAHILKAAGTHLPVPLPMGDVQVLELDEGRVLALLLHYLEGEPITVAQLTPDLLYKIGAFIARWHNICAQLLNVSDKGINPLVQDSKLQRPRLDFEGLFGAQSIYQHEGERIYTDEQRTLMDTAKDKVRAAMDARGSNGLLLVHGDLLLDNLLLHNGEVRALDFEYCGFGYDLYDLTPLLWQLKPEPSYPAWEDALWAGYTALRPLPYRHLLETFIVARQVASMRWIAANQHNPAIGSEAPALLQRRAVELKTFLDTGVLKRGMW